MLHLAILSEYDYWIKLDPDVVFTKTLPIHLLHDMTVRGALFAHTAQYPIDLVSPCSHGIVKAIQDFRLFYQKESTTLSSSWDGRMCSSDPHLQIDSDRYYTNFIIGRTEYFQDPRVLSLARFLSEYPHGFFEHRWTDQLFFQFALGLFLVDFQKYVVDYTEFRCAPRTNCWMSALERTQDDSTCANGGHFHHTKNNKFASNWNRYLTQPFPPVRSVLPFETKYHHNCQGTRWEGTRRDGSD
jgi:hypothetical protein